MTAIRLRTVLPLLKPSKNHTTECPNLDRLRLAEQALGTGTTARGAPTKPTLVRAVAKAMEGLHLVLGASFGRIIPRATRHHAIGLGLCVLRISREG